MAAFNLKSSRQTWMPATSNRYAYRRVSGLSLGKTWKLKVI